MASGSNSGLYICHLSAWPLGQILVCTFAIFSAWPVGQILVCTFAICQHGQWDTFWFLHLSFVSMASGINSGLYICHLSAGPVVTLIFHSFFSSLVNFKYLFLLGFFHSMVRPDSKINFFLLIITRSDLPARIWSFVCISKYQIILWVLFSKTDSGLCMDLLIAWSNFSFLHNSQWINFPTLSILVSYYFFASLLHSLIMWFIVSNLSPHNLHLIFCCLLSIFALI